jgi:hypothetical protein
MKQREEPTIFIRPRYRFNDKLSLNYSFNFLRRNNNRGYVDSLDEDLNTSTQKLLFLLTET